MIFFVIMLLCSLTLAGAFYFCFITAGSEKKQILLGVTLPKEALEQEEIQSMAREYKKKLNQCMICMILVGIPVHALMAADLSVFMIVYMIWAVLLYWIPSRLMKQANRKLYQLKCEKKWMVGETKTVYVDTKASTLARTYPLSSYHFLLSALMCLLPVFVSDSVASYFKQEMAIIIFITSLSTKIVFYLLYRGFFQGGNKVYSHDTKINQKCIGLRRNIYGSCLVILSYMDSISFVVMEWGMEKEEYVNGFTERMILFCIIQTLEVVFLLSCIIQMEKRKKEILSQDKTPILIDEDEYWKGMYYNNPKDKRIFVQDRIFESNLTFNMGHPIGKAMAYGLTILAAVSIIWPSILLFRMEHVPYQMKIKESSVSFTSGGYNLEVELEDIEKVTLLEKLPDKKLARVNGGATDEYLLGKFRMEDIGNCYMYVYQEYPLILQVETEEMTVFFNSTDVEETKELYEELCSRVQ